MILTRSRIIEAIQAGRIVFEPAIDFGQVGLCSVDLRLGNTETIPRKRKGVIVTPGMTDSEGFFETRALPLGQPFILYENKLTLMLTHERIKLPNDIVGLIEGKSTLARWGLSVHTTAPLINAGFNAPIALELINHGENPFQFTPGVSKVCQVILFDASPPIPQEVIDALSSYAGQKSSEPKGS